jgi:hypothetical protein
MVKQTKQPLKVVEVQVHISSRGRSVVNGTVAFGGDMRTVKRELSDREKSQLESLIVDILHIDQEL